jgi:hypothetical protein
MFLGSTAIIIKVKKPKLLWFSRMRGSPAGDPQGSMKDAPSTLNERRVPVQQHLVSV